MKSAKAKSTSVVDIEALWQDEIPRSRDQVDQQKERPDENFWPYIELEKMLCDALKLRPIMRLKPHLKRRVTGKRE